MKFFFNRFFLLFFFLFVVGCMIFISYYVRIIYSSESINLVFCDVGQGDATLLTYGTFQMLIDAGPDQSVLSCLFEYMPLADTTIEIAVLTHADSDHYKGFNAVLNNYLVAEMWIAPFNKDEDGFNEFKQLLSDKMRGGTRLRVVSQGDFFTLFDHISVAVLWPKLPKNKPTETMLSDGDWEFNTNEKWSNDLSIALKMRIFDHQILLTGDIEKSAEQALVEGSMINKVQVLKVAHHGSKTSSTKSFLEKAQPEIAAISSGVNNQHGHPVEEVIASLEDLKATILRTDQLSTFSLLFEENNGIKILKEEKRGR